MKLIKSIVVMAAGLAATIGYAGDSAPFRLDTVTTSTSPVVDSLSISWNASWIGGNANATVVIKDNGTEVKRTTGAGEFTYTLTGAVQHELTYTTYIEGVAQSEVYAITVYSKYEVTFDGGSVGEVIRYVAPGKTIGTLPTPARTGYTFAGWWTTADGGTQISASTIVTGNVTYHAHWTVNQYTVTFNANGGSGGTTKTQNYGTAIVAPTVTRTGYTLTGWSPSVPATMPASNSTYVAQWSANTYTVTFNANGGTVSPSSKSVTYDSNYGTLPTPSMPDYSFDGWYTSAGGGTEITVSTRVSITSSQTLYAHWTAGGDFPDVTTWQFYEEADDEEGLNLAAWEDWNETDVAFWFGAGVNMAIPVVGNVSASDVALVAGTYSGYGTPRVVSDEWMFAKHYTTLKNAIGYDPYDDADFDEGAYGPVFEDDVGGRNYSLSMDIWPEKKVVSGRKWILLEMGGNPTKGCKTFYLGLKGQDDAGYSRFRIYATPDQGVSQTPSSWSSLNELAALPMPIGSGTTTGSGMYASGTRVTLSATPNVGYEFDGWYDAESEQLLGTSASLSYVTTGADKAIFARFRQGTVYTVTFDANGGSLKSANAVMTVTGGALGNRILPTPTRDGYTFAGWWTSASGGTQLSAATIVSDDVTYYAHWNANTYTVTFNANGGTGGWSQTLDYGAGIVAPVVSRTGYTFTGWSPAPAATVPAHDVSYVAQWTANGYSIAYNPNGGSGTMEATAATYDSEATVATNGFTWAGHVFAGWATNETGEVIYTAGQPVTNLTAQSSGVVTLYAVWDALVVAAPVVAPTDGTVFTEESCTVTLTCATEGAAIYYSPRGATPRLTDAYLYTGPFTITDTATIKAVAVLDGVRSEYVTATITKRGLALGEAASADASGAALNWTTGGDAQWTPVSDATASSGYSAQSGTIGDAAGVDFSTTWLQTVVSGAGTITFRWKVDCEWDDSGDMTWDHVAFYTNGVEAARMDGTSGWEELSFTFPDAGTHTLRWTFMKDDYNEEVFADCAWVSGFTWTPAGGSADVVVDVGSGISVTVPGTWIAAHENLVRNNGGNVSAALASKAANGRMSVAECYVVGVDPEKVDEDFKITSITIGADGTPVVEFDPPQAEWNVQTARPVVKGAAELGGEWQTVTEENKAGFRFFKVVVELP